MLDIVQLSSCPNTERLKLSIKQRRYSTSSGDTVAAKKMVTFYIPFRPIQSASHWSCKPCHFCSICTRVQLVIMRMVCRSLKMDSQLVCSPTRIYCFILPLSSKVFWSSTLLFFDFGQVLRLRLDWDRSRLSMINQPSVANQIRSSPNVIT